jgi:hypothetical protein
MTIADEPGQIGDGREVLARGRRIAVDLDIVFLADRYADLESIDRVQPQSFAE